MLARLVAVGALACVALATAPGEPERTGEPKILATTTAPDWGEILGRPARETRLPEPADEIVWREDLTAALAEARETNRPLLVTLRCLPCEQCAAFDKDVLEGGGGVLDEWLGRFVTVRLTSMRDVDKRLLPFDRYQDLDLSWWGYLMSPGGALYGVYGGRDHVSDATRISVESFAATMRRVLLHHYDPRRASWGLDRPAPALTGPATTPTDLPGWEAWKKRGHPEAADDQCLHCHQVVDVLRMPGIENGTIDKAAEFAPWPLPENVGITLDRDDGLKITAVEPDSPADVAGLRAGDLLGAAAGTRLFGQADLRGALHRLPGGMTLGAEIDLVVTRMDAETEPRILEATLVLPPGWRAGDNSWRISVTQGELGGGLGFTWPLAANAKLRKARGIGAGEMGVAPWFGRGEPEGPAWDAGLRASDVIVAVDGESPDLIGRPFCAWWRARFDPGDAVTLTVVGPDGARRDVVYDAP